MMLTTTNKEKVSQIEALNTCTILTHDDWDSFKLLFDEVYVGFLARLKEHMPNLTPSEIRLLCLTKLNLNTKQMAANLGISPDSIKKSRHRLRKKISLSEDTSLHDVIKFI